MVTPRASSSVEIGPSRRIVLFLLFSSVRRFWYLWDLFIGSAIVVIKIPKGVEGKNDNGIS